MNKPKHMLITYSSEKAESGHVDPNFTKLVYGNSKKKGETIRKNITPGSYIFFNTRIDNKRYITSYFYVEKMLYKGEHDHEINALGCSASEDKVIIVGSRTFSKVLTIPLVLDRKMIGKIKSLEADAKYFSDKKKKGKEELEAIKDKTLNPAIITEEEKEMLIDLCKNRG
ncbi:hypothetical protein [Bacillus paranthracis]|uniref:hypothetical protein n=1 Tax=Bacillus paranthracis TaxID=2026186 RepID=UPI0015815E99|nr:hypothetical protein [Bacillus paranthracis]NUJ08465.1 hypothetical protein [Bacillus paranthracis]NUJ08536.1 hypothetical protein [Bacillus paranthracis]